MGTPHSNHHFIPDFLLRQWHSGGDDKLSAFAWRGDKLEHSRRRGKAVAKVLGLYALNELPPEKRNVVESKVFQNIDSKGAEAHRRLVEKDLKDLSDEGAVWWSRFVASMMIRAPWTLAEYEARAPDVLLQSIFDDPDPAVPDPSQLTKDVFASNPHLARSITVRGMVRFVERSQVQEKIMGSVWSRFDVGASPLDLVIGDNPILRTGSMEGDYILLFPLSPTKLFCIANEGNVIVDRIRDLSPRDLVARANRDMAAQAKKYLFATKYRHEALARRYLRSPLVDPY